MRREDGSPASILLLSLHGYVAADPVLGKPDTGGQVTFVLELGKRLAERGHQVDIVTRRFEGQAAVDVAGAGLRVWRVPCGGPAFIRKEDMHEHIGEFVTNFLAATADAGLRYDLVNSHYWDAGWAGLRIAEALRIPHIHTPHSLGWWKQQGMGGAKPELEREFRFEERIRKEFLVYRRCDQLIATSPEQVEVLTARYDVPEERATMIPPGIDERRYAPVAGAVAGEVAARERLGFGEHDVYCIGRAASNKGFDLLLRALPPLRAMVGDARLQLAAGAGSPADRRLVEEWRALAEQLGVSSHVRWLGYVPDEAMAAHYRAAGAFALPSRYEPFGMTAVEAMACGTPAVVTVHGGLHHMIDFGVTGLYADPTRLNEFAAMLAMPLRYPQLRARLAEEGARFARRELGWSGIAGRTLELFEREAERHARERPAAAVSGPVS